MDNLVWVIYFSLIGGFVTLSLVNMHRSNKTHKARMAALSTGMGQNTAPVPSMTTLNTRDEFVIMLQKLVQSGALPIDKARESLDAFDRLTSHINGEDLSGEPSPFDEPAPESKADDICPECGDSFNMSEDYLCPKCREQMNA